MRKALAAIKAGGVAAMAHITGGGFYENLPRVLPDGAAARLDASAWSSPPVFRWLAATGRVPPRDMLTTFNCGIGYVLIVKPGHVEAVVSALQEAGEQPVRIGEIVNREGDGEAVVVEGLTESWPA